MSWFEKIKTALTLSPAEGADGSDPLGEPQLGFKILYYQERKSVGVRVIAARNLPTTIGSVKPKGYLVKVKLYPGKEKFETTVLPSASPCFDEHFLFPAGISHMGQFVGKFVTFTIYADLGGATGKQRKPVTKQLSMRNQIGALISGGSDSDVKLRSKVNRSESVDRFSLNSRRTIGAISFSLDRSIFTDRGKGGAFYTPDIWRTIKTLTGSEIKSRESKKGSLEISMKYSNSEDGRNDMLQISLTKFRCSMATMQSHEQLGGNLYLKMATHEYDVVVSKWKGDTFAPTISMRIEKDSATMITTINNYNLDKTKVIVKLKCRNAMQQKHLLGTIVIDRDSEIFNNIIANPTMEDTKMIDFQ